MFFTIGPALAVLFSLEAVVPLLSSPSMNLIYQATISSFPGCVFLIGAFGNLIVLCLLG